MSMSHNKKTNEPRCFTIKQWALCLSLVLLVISIVFTVCAVLAKLHTDLAWERLNADIEEEREKNIAEDHLSPNEAKLHASRHSVYLYKWLVFIAMIVGLMNVTGLSLAIYGIVSNIHAAIMPWLIIAVFSYTFGGFFLFAMHDQLIPGLYIDIYTLTYCLAGYFLPLPCWYMIYHHFTILKDRNEKMRSLPTSKSIVGAGGYIHTFDASQTPKQLVV